MSWVTDNSALLSNETSTNIICGYLKTPEILERRV